MRRYARRRFCFGENKLPVLKGIKTASSAVSGPGHMRSIRGIFLGQTIRARITVLREDQIGELTSCRNVL